MSSTLWYAFGAIMAAGLAGAAVGHAFFKMLGTGDIGMHADDDGEGA